MDAIAASLFCRRNIVETKRAIGRKLKVSFALLGLLAVAIATLVLWPSSLPPSPDTETSRLTRDVRIIDTQNGTASAPQSILVRDGMIEAIGIDLDPGGLPIYDADGAFAVPGFWDMHIHAFQLSPQLHLPLWVANGVLNARDMMDCPGESDLLIACHDDKQAWNDAVSSGRLAAPRLVEVASFCLERPDMTAGEARELVKDYSARGLDAKVYNGLRPDAFAAAAEDAQALKLKLVGHLPMAVPLEKAIAAEQTGFEHAHIFARHCFAGFEDWREGRLDDLPAVALAERIVTEHDADLKAATVDAARYAGEQDTAGTIEAGKRADFVLLAANPLDAIANTKRIDAVVQSGRLYDRAKLDALLAFTRGQARTPHNWAKLIWGFLRSSVNSEL